MPSPSVNFMQIFSVFALAFTTPAFTKAIVLACGTILTPGPRTVSAALRAVGLKDESKFGKYHRLLNRDKWDSILLSQLLLQLIVEIAWDQPVRYCWQLTKPSSDVGGLKSPS